MISNSPKYPLVSVVTVVFNDEQNIEKTINSVIKQTYGNIEYIIIDGGSTDNTLKIINSHKDKISVIVSEKDKGIYDAMNKAINLSKGEWISFMNSNDAFYSNDTVKRVIKKRGDADVIYGNMINPNNGEIIFPRPLDKFWMGMPFNHQSTFTKTVLYKKRNYNLKYTISSVYDFYYYYFKDKRSFRYIDEVIAIYDMKGISAFSYRWLIDYWEINAKYSKDKKIQVAFRFVYIFFSRLKSNIKRKIKR